MDYQGGIHYEVADDTQKLNHEVSLVGWGTTDEGQEYWIGRNSWGTYWGEHGFFRIDMNDGNLKIDTDCIWAVPVVNQIEQNYFYQMAINRENNDL